MPYLSIVIPIYNEAQTLQEIILRILRQDFPFEYEIILVDSGSSDGSTEITQSFAYPNSLFKTVLLRKNSGKGFSVREGLRYATGEIVIIQDADLEYDPQDYKKILAPFQNPDVNFVLGSRRLGAKTWRFRTRFRKSTYLEFANIGSEFLTWVFQLLYRSKVSDTQTMFKVFRRHLVDQLHLSANGFDLDWEILCKLTRRGETPVEVPVSYYARTLQEGKKLRLIRDGIAAVIAMLRFRFANLTMHVKTASTQKEQQRLLVRG